MAKIKLDLSRMAIPATIPYLKTIAGKTAGSSRFTDLATEATALETANTNYEKSKSTAEQLRMVRDNALAEASDAAHTLASGAQKITTDAADLKDGGWELVADHAPVGQLSPPANLSASGGDVAGSVDLSWDPQNGVQAHIPHWATSPGGPWTQGYVGKKSSCNIAGLASGQEHWFRVQANGAAGPSDWAGPIVKRAT